MPPPETTRFAPSPTGRLHLGHAFAAWTAYDLARRSGGRFLLRIEDIDEGRCRPEFEVAIFEDLRWLGLSWEEPVRRQSTRLDVYRQTLDGLSARGLTYPCFCTRQMIADEIARMPSAPHGADGPAYPGTCRQLSSGERARRLASGVPHAVRLNIPACLDILDGRLLDFRELGRGPEGQSGMQTIPPDSLADVVLGRKDVGVSYHLAVVVDDADQGVTLVTRGEDLFGATGIQRLLQEILGLPAPRYHHHRLVRDAAGRRLAKRDEALTLASLRAQGTSPAEVLERLMTDNQENQQE